MNIDNAKLNDPALVEATKTGHAHLHFSQVGEDAVLWHLFQGKRDGFYVDIGCHHPFRFSNTALFSHFANWSGLNVDVDETLLAEFHRQRTRDINVAAAIGRDRGQAEVTLFHEAAVNSLDPETVAEFKQHFQPRDVKTVDVFPLRDILEARLPLGRQIDLLSVDVEGLDHAVLESNDWTRFRPDVVAVEVHDFDLAHPQANETFRLMTAQGYRLNSHLVMTSIYSRLP